MSSPSLPPPSATAVAVDYRRQQQLPLKQPVITATAEAEARRVEERPKWASERRGTVKQDYSIYRDDGRLRHKLQERCYFTPQVRV